MSERSNLISKLLSDFKTRAAYIQAKVSTLVPSQIRGLRLKSKTPRQPDLARAAGMHQSRISALETAGNNPTIGTLSEIAAALGVGLRVEFVPFSEMLAWENNFSQDRFAVTPIEHDAAFLGEPLQPVDSTQAKSIDVQSINYDLYGNLVSTKRTTLPDWMMIAYGREESKHLTVKEEAQKPILASEPNGVWLKQKQMPSSYKVCFASLVAEWNDLPHSEAGIDHNQIIPFKQIKEGELLDARTQ